MDSLRSPKSAPPRPRPGGPRRPTTYKTTPSTPQPFQRGLPDEAAPSYSGRSSPVFSSPTGSTSSPVASNYDQAVTDFSLSHPPTRAIRDQAVQVSPAEAPTPPVSRAVTPAVKVIAKQPTLTPPPPLNFDSTPIQWRGMTRESAQWTVSSGELQEVVSRAIRKTAQESFIRLLSVKVLDEELKTELERLDTLKATTQSQYRFNMHRRTMLLQSALTLSTGEGDYTALASLTTQLADITAACDKQMLELLRIADHRAQIQQLQDVHVASALALALRKLNASYAKRTGELRQSREQIDQLKAELEEAWKVAEDMAQEMDDLDNFHSGFSSDEGESEAIDDDQRIDESVRLAEVIGITGTAVAMKATLTQLVADKAKEREKEAEYTRQRRVSAARKRSSRASKASLRLRKPSLKGSPHLPDFLSVNSRTTESSGSGRPASAIEQPVPPMPTLRVEAPAAKGPKVSSFLEMAETRPVSPASPTIPGFVPPVARTLSTSNHDANSQREDRLSIRSKHSTFDFDIPPIAIHPAEENSSSSALLSRRVQSMNLSARASPEPMVDNSSSLKRASSEHRSFDGWPWGRVLSKNERRRSAPLSATMSPRESRQIARQSSLSSLTERRRALPPHPEAHPQSQPLSSATNVLPFPTSRHDS